MITPCISISVWVDTKEGPSNTYNGQTVPERIVRLETSYTFVYESVLWWLFHTVRCLKRQRGLVLYKYLSVLSTVKHFNSFYNLCTVWRFKSVHCSFDHASTQVSHKIALKEKFTKIFKFNKFDTRAIEFLFSLHVLSP